MKFRFLSDFDEVEEVFMERFTIFNETLFSITDLKLLFMTLLLELEDLRQKYLGNIPSDVLDRWISEKQELLLANDSNIPKEVSEFRNSHKEEMQRLDAKFDADWTKLINLYENKVPLFEIGKYRESCFKELSEVINLMKAERESHPSYGSVLAIEREIEHEEMSAHFDVDDRTGTYDTARGVEFLNQANSDVSDIEEFKRRVSISTSVSSHEPEP